MIAIVFIIGIIVLLALSGKKKRKKDHFFYFGKRQSPGGKDTTNTNNGVFIAKANSDGNQSQDTSGFSRENLNSVEDTYGMSFEIM